MLETLDNLILKFHVITGSISLILFWIPVLVKKGGNIHKKVGKAYIYGMWMVVLSSFILSMINALQSHVESAIFLGYLTIITAYPLWYGYEILNQSKVWSDQYFSLRKLFSYVLFIASFGMIIGALIIWSKFLSPLMVFFGMLGIGSIKDALMTREEAIQAEPRMGTHIQGMIISGIAAHTAFLAFGGRKYFIEILPGTFQIIPWILPTIIGVVFIKRMKKKFEV